MNMARRRRPRKPLHPESIPLERALDALALARREGLSLRAASRAARTDPRTVLRHTGSAFRKSGGRWTPTAFDRIARGMTVLTREGPAVEVITDSRTASLLGLHANAVATYVETGDEGPLRRLPRHIIRIRGQPVYLEVDPVRLDRLAAGGELHYELYRF
jgi:hypothetical protein